MDSIEATALTRAAVVDVDHEIVVCSDHQFRGCRIVDVDGLAKVTLSHRHVIDRVLGAPDPAGMLCVGQVRAGK